MKYLNHAEAPKRAKALFNLKEGDSNMANVQNLKPIRDPEIARKLQEKSVIKRKQNDKERKLIKEMLLERTKNKDLEEMIDNAIKRAKETDKGFEVYRDTIGEKPTETIEANVGITDIKVELTDE